MVKVEEEVGQFQSLANLKMLAISLNGLSCVYGPNLNRKHRIVWEELVGLFNWWNVPCCLRGNFNIICFPSERLGAVSYSCYV